MHNNTLAIRKHPLSAALTGLGRSAGVALLGGAVTFGSIAVQAQEERRGGSAALLEEVVVTARKRAEESQDVPVAISAYGADQIEALKVRDLTNLSVGMPNVALDDVGTSRGAANFSIRGLGINSSIPGIDPTVGLIVDGVYQGMTVGTVFDTFDLESIEVLRGPQGTLFGRNVTGGAILMNTKKPGDEFELTLRAAADQGDEGGLNSYLMGSVGGPVTDWMAAKFTAYYNDDQGWLENRRDVGGFLPENLVGKDLGAIEQTMFRPVVVITPSDRVELTLRYEYSEVEGDGPVSQCHTNGSGVPCAFQGYDREDFKVSIDEPGFQEGETNSFTAQLDWDVDFGDGTITNIFGWRDYDSSSLGDIDAQPVWLFHAPAWLQTEQYSNELRYNGLFNNDFNVTAGVYYFNNDITYHERREFGGIATGGAGPFLQADGGGTLDVESWTVFGQVDYDLNSSLTLTAGINYSEEDKEARIVSLIDNVNSPCNVVVNNDCPFDFEDEDSWDAFSPKLGFTWHTSDSSRIYGSWSRGFRSGGYNLRNTSADPNDIPGPFDQEQVDSFEVGYKSEFSRGKLNAAVFYNQVDDMQREINLPSQGVGVVQLIRNTAEATLFGVEVDGTFALTDNLVAQASIGWLDAEYDDVSFDLNGDGVVDGADESLDLPRAAELTYSLGLNHDMDIGDLGYLSSRINYAYRDESAYTDNNLGTIDEQDILDIGFDFYTANGHWVFSLYGRNLLDTVKQGGDTQLPDSLGGLLPWGGSFSPLSKGTRYGIEVTYNL
ncbi:TonB-dependent receptor [Parahaliea aestuarii]|uniref:TonB-dependent receptor n=1 Tax=Parahaliea aestuarii TaxID=1852021 RepID=A0A5C9A040_9GAMM|nr:TonB-dependent receptor [Parahaliea aestuarii]TXS93364.1 TonB-dependent receptor [Parahaliea aestuarii]